MNTIINISDSPISKLKRKVKWTTLSILEEEREIRLYTICRFYENLSGTTYGNPINTSEIKPFERILYARNTNQVNPINGIMVNPQLSGDTTIWIDAIGNVVEFPMGQFDFFIQKMDEEIILSQIIESIIYAEDQIYQTYNK